jgi:hypothetical protein
MGRQTNNDHWRCGSCFPPVWRRRNRSWRQRCYCTRLAIGLLDGWNLERRQGIDEATRNTMVNGRMVNLRSPVFAFIRNTIIKLLWSIPAVAEFLTQKAMSDTFFYKPCENAFFLASQRGGHKISQTWLRQRSGPCQLSDEIFFMGKQSIALLVIINDDKDSEKGIQAELDQVQEVLDHANIDSTIISSSKAIVLARRCFEEIPSPAKAQDNTHTSHLTPYFSCDPTTDTSGMDPSTSAAMRRYDKKSIGKQLGPKARFILLRRDLYLFSVSRNISEFQEGVNHLQSLLS